VACVYDRATAAAAFRAIDSSRAEVDRLIRRTRPAVVVIEACSLAGWVHDLCAALGVPCRVANTGAEAWKYKHVKVPIDE
jgi:transposase